MVLCGLIMLDKHDWHADQITLQWHHNECDGVHYLDCLLSRLFRRKSKKTWNLRVAGLCDGNSPVTSGFLSQRTSNAENVLIWWRHHAWLRLTDNSNDMILSLVISLALLRFLARDEQAYKRIDCRGRRELTLNSEGISYYIHYKLWDEIIHPFPNFNRRTVELWEWRSIFIPHFTEHVITYPCLD